MGESLPLSGPIDLEALDRFLMSDASPRTACSSPTSTAS